MIFFSSLKYMKKSIINKKSKKINKKNIIGSRVWKHHTRIRGVVFTWLVSYLSILVIPVLVSIVLLTLLMNIIVEETNHSYELELSTIDNNINTIFNKTSEIVLELNENEFIQQMTRLPEKSNLIPVSTYKISKILTNYYNNNKFIQDIYIVFPNSNTITTTKNSFSMEEYYRYNFLYEKQVEYSQWEYIIASKSNSFFHTYHQDNLFYIQTIPILGAQKEYANVVVEFSPTKLSNYFQDIQQNSESKLLLFDKEDQLLLSIGVSPVEYDLFKELGKREENYKVTVQGKKYFVIYRDSNFNHWNLIKLIPESEYGRKIQYVRYGIIVSFVLCIGIGGIIATIMVSRQYRPINEMLRILGASENMTCEGEKNEFFYLKEAILELQDGYKVAESKRKQEKSDYREQFLINLLQGVYKTSEYIDQESVKYGIRTISSRYVLIEVSYYKEENEQSEDRNRENIKRVLEGALIQYGIVFPLNIGEQLLFIINLSEEYFKKDEETRVYSMLEQLLQQVQGVLKEEYEIQTYLIVSTIREDMNNIAQLYSQVCDSRKLAETETKQTLLFCNQIQHKTFCYAYSYTMEKSFVELLNQGRIQEAIELVQEVWNNQRSGTCMDISIKKQLLFHIMGNVIRVLNDKGVAEQYQIEVSPYDKLMNCNSQEELKKCMVQVLWGLKPYLPLVEEVRSNKELQEKVEQFVQANYRDCGLSNTTIADAIGLNQSYLSSEYKKQTGHGLQEYITEVRLMVAIELLCGTNITIEQIAEHIGFSNSRTYIRNFKKKYGVTPSQFRSLNQEVEQELEQGV